MLQSGNPSPAFKKLPSASRPTASSTVTRVVVEEWIGLQLHLHFLRSSLVPLDWSEPVCRPRCEKSLCATIYFSKSTFQSETGRSAPSVFVPARLRRAEALRSIERFLPADKIRSSVVDAAIACGCGSIRAIGQPPQEFAGRRRTALSRSGAALETIDHPERAVHPEIVMIGSTWTTSGSGGFSSHGLGSSEEVFEAMCLVSRRKS